MVPSGTACFDGSGSISSGTRAWESCSCSSLTVAEVVVDFLAFEPFFFFPYVCIVK